jgi:hypothetical protein
MAELCDTDIATWSEVQADLLRHLADDDVPRRPA